MQFGLYICICYIQEPHLEKKGVLGKDGQRYTRKVGCYEKKNDPDIRNVEFKPKKHLELQSRKGTF